MTRLLRAVTTAACALALLAVPPADAAESRFSGGCSFAAGISQNTLTGPDVYSSVVYADVVLYNPDDGTVVNATVTCELRVNNVVQAAVSQWGSGVVAFADTVTYTASEVDNVDLCMTVDYTSDDTPTAHDNCGVGPTQIPPQVVLDPVNAIFLWVDTTTCSAFLLLAPGVPPVTVGQSGDLYVNGDLFYDCPPEPPPGPHLPNWQPNVNPDVPSGGGYNTGDAGALLLRDPDRQVAAACAYVTDRATGTIAVAGAATEGDIRCVLTDTATGTVLYDETAPAQHATIPANDGPVTVCTAGPVDLRCRPGEPLGRRS